ncbi:MAG: hypothetical protein HY791_02290 [Deltaproteobacteria bacterium]|nr:hypothetical protein [Deltaproteobacteria bacterium]
MEAEPTPEPESAFLPPARAALCRTRVERTERGVRGFAGSGPGWDRQTMASVLVLVTAVAATWKGEGAVGVAGILVPFAALVASFLKRRPPAEPPK